MQTRFFFFIFVREPESLQHTTEPNLTYPDAYGASHKSFIIQTLNYQIT